MQQPPLVVFRADASPRIGTGHVRRCHALATALARQGAAVAFAAHAPAGEAPDERLFAPFELLALPPAHEPAPGDPQAPPHAAWLPGGWRADAAQCIARLQGRAVAAVIVDHYAIDARWHEQVAQALGCRIVAIDDVADRALAADLIVDHNVAPDHSAKYSAVNRRGSPVLGGPAHAMLDPRFADAPRNPAADPVRSIGIFMGGADAPNLSERAWHGLRYVTGFTGAIEIAATRANPHLPRLSALAARDAATTLSVDAADLAAFFGRHELHVGAGGGATWERCCLGAPTLAVVAAENQRSVLLPLASDDVFTLVEPELPDASAIGHAARALIAGPAVRRRQSQRARALVDGHGCARIAERIATLCLR